MMYLPVSGKPGMMNAPPVSRIGQEVLACAMEGEAPLSSPSPFVQGPPLPSSASHGYATGRRILASRGAKNKNTCFANQAFKTLQDHACHCFSIYYTFLCDL